MGSVWIQNNSLPYQQFLSNDQLMQKKLIRFINSEMCLSGNEINRFARWHPIHAKHAKKKKKINYSQTSTNTINFHCHRIFQVYKINAKCFASREPRLVETQNEAFFFENPFDDYREVIPLWHDLHGIW